MVLLQEITNSASEEVVGLFQKLSYVFFVRLAINFFTTFILVRFIYFPTHRSRELFFTFFIFNLLLFLITFLLKKSELSLGTAFGLFAVFHMLRYRTENLTIKDMTYIFLVISLGLLNAVMKGDWIDIATINVIVLVFTYLLESNKLMKREVAKIVEYEKIELVKQERHEELIKDLEGRTGIKINRINVQQINFLKDTALITIYFYE
jgi:hypothetical protein